MVGTEATTETPQPTKWRILPWTGVAAALTYLILLGVSGSSGTSADGLRQAPPEPSVGGESAQPINTSPINTSPISASPVQVSGKTIHRWRIGSAEASLLSGDCVIEHEGKRIAAEQVLLVVDGTVGNVRCRVVVDAMQTPTGRSRVPIAYTLRTLVDPKITSPDYRGAPVQPPVLLDFLPGDGNDTGSVVTAGGYVQQITAPQPGATAGTVAPVQFSDPVIPGPPVIGNPPITFSDGQTERGLTFTVAGGTRSIQIQPRNPSAPPQIQTIPRPEANEEVIIARGGVTVLINDVSAQLPGGDVMNLGTISLSADRVVAWSPLLSNLFRDPSQFSEAAGELYLEGNIVFLQGDRKIYAESMYFNAAAEAGMVLDAEAILSIPEYQGYVRLKSKVLQQINRGNFRAFDAAVTTSRMGVPRYWLQSERLSLSDRQRLTIDPATQQQTVQREPFIESNNNFIYAGGIPIFYWPRLATSLRKPTYYVTGIGVGNDNIFGTQVMVDYDLFQLFGIENAPRGVDWELSTDYLSDRGPAVGTNLDYTLPGLLGVPGPVRGNLDAWGIYDTGRDNLGGDRRSLDPETTTRGRILLRHRHYLPNDYEFIAEAGYLSDRNFLEQYLENEWDQEVDHRTALRLRKYQFNNLFDLSIEAQVNDFFTETQRLPQLDHYLIGGSLLGDRLTYSAHNRVGYNDLSVADLPEDPSEAAEYSPIPGEIPASGLVASTHQEIALPVQLGPVKLVPNVSGEAAHFGEAADGDSLTRLVGQAGIRASLPMWRIDPQIQSSLLNIRGLAHKMEWTAEYSFADSDTNLDELPYYDPLDDNAQEQFRRRFIQDNFGGTLPDRFDPRNYAFRHGIQNLVASPSEVIADDLQLFRVGLNQRWQTKRGLPGRERIVDLFQFDIDLSLFPDADRDNFGETLGPATYDMRYHVGDRVTLLSDGYIDFFDDGLRSVSAGVRSSRPGVGDVYIGLLSLEGPISSTVLRSTLDYRLNEKWIASAGTTYDFGETGNVGQSLALTKIGESFLFQVSVNVDEGRGNTGFGFTIEPRFFPRAKLGRIGGQIIPPPGVEGLE